MQHSYRALAQQLQGEIARGERRVGERMPSVREGSGQFAVSASTMVRCYRYLEMHGWVEARPKSGVYVADWKARPTAQPAAAAQPTLAPPASMAFERFVSLQERMAELYALTSQPLHMGLHLANAAPQWYPTVALARIGQRLLRSHPDALGVYPTGTGWPAFKQALVQYLGAKGLELAADDLLVTNGSTEALAVALRATTQPGDSVAVESPAYFGLFQLLDSLGLKAVEVPCAQDQGMSLEALEYALEHNSSIRAVVLMPGFQNPLGYAMSDSHKRRLLKLIERFGTVLVEDDTFADLSPHQPTAQPVKAWDRLGQVVYCGSFSKSLAPAFRLGWVAGGRYHARIAALKLSQSLVTPLWEQMVLAQYLASGELAPHLRRLRERLAANVLPVLASVRQHFPLDCQISNAGNWWLWVEASPQVDTLAVLRQAVRQGIAFTPGVLFSASGKYSHCMRLTVAQPFSPAMDAALATIGGLLREAV